MNADNGIVFEWTTPNAEMWDDTLNFEPPFGVDADSPQAGACWGRVGKQTFVIYGHPREERPFVRGYIRGKRWGVLAVHYDDLSFQELEALKQTALDLVRMRYGFSE